LRRARPAWKLIALMTFMCARPAFAQTSTPAPSEHAIEFLPRTLFHLSAQHLSSDDERFVWDANFGGELDLVDYGLGRATFVANYEAVLGEQFRNFDPNQGNYTLEGSSSVRVGRLEIAGVFHHVSRHLSDRPKRFPIDWNMVGGRVSTTATAGITHMDARVDYRRVILHTYVDYQWELNAALQNVHAFRPRVAAISGATLQVLGVDGTRGRGTQTGARGEGGVRFSGRAGSVELFIAAERRIDPYPLEFAVDSWVTAGFRLLSR
jgi:hypothetical protein